MVHATHCSLVIEMKKESGEARVGGVGSLFQYNTPAVFLHGFDCRAHAVVDSFHIQQENPLKVRLRRGLELSDMGDARIIYEDIDWLLASQLLEQFFHAPLIRDVASVRTCSAACFYNLSRGIRRRLFVNIHEPDRCALLLKSLRDGAASAARGAGDNGHFTVQPQAVRMLLVVLQSETPLFHGMT